MDNSFDFPKTPFGKFSNSKREGEGDMDAFFAAQVFAGAIQLPAGLGDFPGPLALFEGRYCAFGQLFARLGIGS